MLTRASVAPLRRRCGAVGWNESAVMSSLWDSVYCALTPAVRRSLYASAMPRVGGGKAREEGGGGRGEKKERGGA